MTRHQKLRRIIESLVERKLNETDNSLFGEFEMGNNIAESFQNLYDNFLEWTATASYNQAHLTDEQYERLVTEGQKRLDSFLKIIKTLENGQPN